ncbi:hypothetical protein DTO207G8_2559 [Paecilomyces variotii]|nr:hypothetical protein DTO207G8_2559 [Paecilomyces variotii]KAJ9374560.1 hypothetical protein DTO282E5_643 [Paecilomyces variotii]KAJ9381111.1 hypothetical protein DTO063F5_6321 [Paecilomyces variotii]
MLDAPQDTPRLPLRLLEAFSGVYARNCLQNRVHLRTTRGPKPLVDSCKRGARNDGGSEYKTSNLDTDTRLPPPTLFVYTNPWLSSSWEVQHFVLSSSRHPISPSSPSGGPLIAQTKLVRFKQRPRRFRTPPLLGLSF